MTTEERLLAWLGVILFIFSVVFQGMEWLHITPDYLAPYTSNIVYFLVLVGAVTIAVLVGRQTKKVELPRQTQAQPQQMESPLQPSTGMRPTPTHQEDFLISLAQEQDNIRMREIRVRVPSGQIYTRHAYFYTVGVGLRTGCDNAVDFKLLFKDPTSVDSDSSHQVELLRIGTSGVGFLGVVWASPNPFRLDVAFDFAAAVSEAQIRHPQFTLAASPSPRQYAMTALVFFYTIRDADRVFFPTFNARNVAMPIKFQTEVWAEANNRPRTRLLKLQIDARTWDNVCVTELQ